jgi:hypothetical protein
MKCGTKKAMKMGAKQKPAPKQKVAKVKKPRATDNDD